MPFSMLSVLLVTTAAAVAPAQDSVADLASLKVAVRLAEHESDLDFTAAGPLDLIHTEGTASFPRGKYRLHHMNGSPTIFQYRVFGKSFKPGEEDDALAYLEVWRDKGYDMESITLGRRYLAPSGTVIDTRIYWISFGVVPTEAKAETLRRALEHESVWAWVRKQRLHEGRGFVSLLDVQGQRLGQWELPLTLVSTLAVTLEGINTGFWQEKRTDQAFAGNLLIRPDEYGKLELIERVHLDTYLQGVLPAEMPAEWPLEALKAQAVAARSEIIFNAAKTHALEAFDFCALEHCRAYGAESLRADSTDAAVRATHSEVITHGGDVVPTVFSANCGGWTEDNDAVWSGPAHPALRAVADFPGSSNPAPRGPVPYGTEAWVRGSPKAYCSGDAAYFRWERRYTASELSAHVAKQHRTGPVTGITLGQRAPGGRLKWVTVEGRDDSVTIRKELPIRLAFGGLPSAMFTVEFSRSPEGLRSVIFRGGGRGHGVGLCQQGARGMALAGNTYGDILRHYFTGVTIERMASR